MGFGNFLKGVASAAVDHAVETKKRIDNHVTQLEYKSDEEVIRIFKSSSGERKLAASKVLKSRGYGNQD